jgi:hypothetical protein
MWDLQQVTFVHHHSRMGPVNDLIEWENITVAKGDGNAGGL